MTLRQDSDYFPSVVLNLVKLPRETEWVEFKVDNSEPESIGEYISALSNGAALNGETSAYLVWGIEDDTHAIVGTNFAPYEKRIGNQPLEIWLHRLLNPAIDFKFHEFMIDSRKVVLLQISPASGMPVTFRGNDFIRIGNVKGRLKDYPSKEGALWQALNQTNFEKQVAAEWVEEEEVLLKLDFPAYFDLLQVPLPDGRAAILDALKEDGLIESCDAGGWNITNLGAILLARNLGDFRGLRRKKLRVIQYRGSGRMDTIREFEETRGYATGFERIIGYIMALVPSNEVIGHSLRQSAPMFPVIAVRELVANALIHQDFLVTGAGPMVEIFDDWIEITNPGMPLIDTDRFVDTPPRTRNEDLGALMRRFGICEERGSGIDKVVNQVELFQLPAPLFESVGNSTRAVLFDYKALSDMDKTERVRACYLHACLRWVMRQTMNNTSIRERFGISREGAAQASRLLKEALESKMIVMRDPEAGFRNRAYLPFWAGTGKESDRFI